jgi:hypothetical protein
MCKSSATRAARQWKNDSISLTSKRLAAQKYTTRKGGKTESLPPGLGPNSNHSGLFESQKKSSAKNKNVMVALKSTPP